METAQFELHIDVDDERWETVPNLVDLMCDVATALRQVAACRVGPGVSAGVMLANDEAVRALNKQYRGIDKSTNVLSFPSPPGTVDGDGKPYLGDIIVAFETTNGEAQSADLQLVRHLLHLVVHGVLHLTGHDHEDDADAAVMEKTEATVLALLGVPDPYAA